MVFSISLTAWEKWKLFCNAINIHRIEAYKSTEFGLPLEKDSNNSKYIQLPYKFFNKKEVNSSKQVKSQPKCNDSKSTFICTNFKLEFP